MNKKAEIKCPICNEKATQYFESSHKAFVHHDPFIGLTMYGPFSAEKETLCSSDEYLHIKFSDNSTHLIKLNCPTDSVTA